MTRRRRLPSRRWRSRANRHAFTLVEFLIAAFLTLLVLGAAGLGTTGAQNALRSASDTYTGARVAATVIDTARALGCGEDTDPRYVPSSRTNCSRELSGTASATIGDLAFAKTLGVVDGRAVEAAVEYTTSWLPVGWRPTAALQCNPKPTIDSDQLAGQQSRWITPQLLERRVTVTIGKTGSTQVTREWRQLSAASERVRAVSSSLDPSKLGALLITGVPAKTVVEISAAGSSGKLTRAVPSTCGAANSVLFPYLAPGVYSVVVSKTGTPEAAVSFTVNGGAVSVFP
jgi:hypothetical protein